MSDEKTETFKPSLSAKLEPTSLQLKRGYLIPDTLLEKTIKCKKCGEPVQLFHDYIPYPVVGSVVEHEVECQECFTEIKFRYRINITFDVELPSTES